MKSYVPINITHRSILLNLVVFSITMTISTLLVFGGIVEWSLSRHYNAEQVLFVQYCLCAFFVFISSAASVFIYKSDLKKQHYSFYEASSEVLNKLNSLGINDVNIKKAIQNCYSMNGYIDISNASEIIKYEKESKEINSLKYANKSLKNI